MAPGWLKKIGNFFKKAWDTTKKVFHKVAPVVKTVLPFLAPIIPGGPATTTLIQKGIDIGQKFIPKNSVANAGVDFGTALKSGQGLFNEMGRKLMTQSKAQALETKMPALDSPRIKLRMI